MRIKDEQQLQILKESLAPLIGGIDIEYQLQTLRKRLAKHPPIDENILPLVQALWELGICTSASCEGHLKSNFNSNPTPYPYVYWDAWNEHESLLRKLILILGLWNGGIEPTVRREKWVIFPRYIIDKRGEQSFSIFLQPKNINPEKSEETLCSLQCSAKELARFLKNFRSIDTIKTY